MDAGSYYDRKREEAHRLYAVLEPLKAKLKEMQTDRFLHGDRMNVPADEARLYNAVRQMTRALETARYVGD